MSLVLIWMSNRKTAVTKKTYLFLIMGLAIFLLYLYFFVDIPEMIEVIRSSNLGFYALAALASVGNITLYSLIWQLLLKITSVKTSFRKTNLFVWTGIFVDFIIPFEAVSSDIVKTYLMVKDTGENTGKIAASVMSKRILSMATTIGGLTIGLLFLAMSYQIPQFVLFFVLFIASFSFVSLVLICYFIFREEKTRRIMDRVMGFVVRVFRGRWQLSNLKSKVYGMLEVFHHDVAVLSGSRRRLLLPSLLSIAAWFLDISTMLLVFYAIGANISFLQVVVVYSLMLAVQAIPFGIPAEIGLVEVVMTWLYTAFGVPSGASAAATVLTRALTFWSRILIGYVAAQWVGFKTLGEHQKEA
jgi:uncharacterized protein (TIRG00374 family)